MGDAKLSRSREGMSVNGFRTRRPRDKAGGRNHDGSCLAYERAVPIGDGSSWDVGGPVRVCLLAWPLRRSVPDSSSEAMDSAEQAAVSAGKAAGAEAAEAAIAALI